MVRRHSYGARQSGPSAEFAAMWSQLPPARQMAMLRQVQAAFAEVKADAEADEPTHEEPAEMASRYKKHGKVQVLASARRTPPMSPQQARRVDQAWTRLNADLDKTRKGRR